MGLVTDKIKQDYHDWYQQGGPALVQHHARLAAMYQWGSCPTCKCIMPVYDDRTCLGCSDLVTKLEGGAAELKLGAAHSCALKSCEAWDELEKAGVISLYRSSPVIQDWGREVKTFRGF